MATVRAQPSRGAKRPLDDAPAPSTARRRTEAALPPPPPEPVFFVGSILSYDSGKGYGFIHCDAVPEGDVYFQRLHLPPEVQASPRGALKGQEVEFCLHLTPDGKPRADVVRMLGPYRAPSKGAIDPRTPPPPLDAATIEDMTRYLEERGGAMDFGKFTRDFRGVKKSQLEDYFRLVPEEDDARGRWQITLPDVEPLASLDKEPRGQKEETQEPPADELLGHFTGVISLYDTAKGYGFIKSDDIQQGDVYFKRTELSPEASSLPRPRLVGAAVEFDGYLTARGRARATAVRLLDGDADAVAPPPPPPPPPSSRAAGESGPTARAERERERAAALAAPLDADTIAEMRRFLEEQGGAMDYGKFSNAFAGVKKAQLEDHFTLVPEGQDAGGRWQITLPGVDPLPPEEREARGPEREREREREREPRPRPLIMEPSSSMWLVGFVKKWDQRKNFGFLVANGLPDVFMHRNDLPADLQTFRGSLQGVEMAFELGSAEDGKLRATSVRALLEPDGRGGWQMRRV